jgi:hypothetical protein
MRWQLTVTLPVSTHKDRKLWAGMLGKEEGYASPSLVLPPSNDVDVDLVGEFEQALRRGLLEQPLG